MPTTDDETEEAPLTWEQLEEETHLRNISYLEVEHQLTVMESYVKKDISITMYHHAYAAIEGYMLEVKRLHANFRRKAFANKLAKNPKFLDDSKGDIFTCTDTHLL